MTRIEITYPQFQYSRNTKAKIQSCIRVYDPFQLHWWGAILAETMLPVERIET